MTEQAEVLSREHLDKAFEVFFWCYTSKVALTSRLLQ